MALNTLFEIECENFNHYFANEVADLTPDQRSGLPKDVLSRLYRGGKFRPNNIAKLGFFAKIFILWKALRKKWWIIVEDDVKGIGIYEFTELQKAEKKRTFSVDQSSVLKSTGSFVLANKELADALGYLNRLSVSPAYNYVNKAKNIKQSKAGKWNEEMKYLSKFLSFWEGHKKAWVTQMSMSVPEMLVLLYVYSKGTDVRGSEMYKDVYKQAYQSSPAKIKTAFGSLQRKGMLLKTGSTSEATLRITPLGIDTMTDIINKYAVNC